MMNEHTAKAFDSDLQELTRLVAEMGGLAERMIVESVDALIRRDIGLDHALAQHDVAADQGIDGVHDHPFGKTAHLRNQPGQLLKIAVECLGGMF